MSTAISALGRHRYFHPLVSDAVCTSIQGGAVCTLCACGELHLYLFRDAVASLSACSDAVASLA